MLAHAYEYVCALVKYQNISKAAAHLCITQPALTKYINQLEADLGIKLFYRGSAPITLTPAGKIFAEKAQSILEMERHLISELELIASTPHGKLNIGITPEFFSHILPYILPHFQETYSNINLNFVEGHNRFLLEELDRGRIDLALTSSAPLSPNITAEPFLRDTILLAVPKEHPIAQSFNLTLNSPLSPFYLPPSQIQHGDFIVCSQEIGMGALARSYFKKYNLNPKIIMELTRHENALRLASTGLGMIFTPSTTPLRLNLIKPMAFFSIEDPLFQRERFICYSKDASNLKLITYFIPILINILQEKPFLRPPVCQLIREVNPQVQQLHTEMR